MAKQRPPARRGTRTLTEEPQDASQSKERPWWRGFAIAGSVLAALLVMTLVVNLTKSGPSSRAGGSSAANSGPSAPSPTRSLTEAGGNPGTATQTVVSGVPVGYPHTETGAVQAAVNYEIARSSAAYFTDSAVRHKVLDAMATNESRAQLISNDDTGMSQVLVSLGINSSNTDTLVARAAALGTKADSYSDQVATVEVWMAGVIGTTGQSAPLPVSASWTTYTLTLQWQHGDWKLAALSSADGPTPLDTGTNSPSSLDEFRAADRGFDAPPYVG